MYVRVTHGNKVFIEGLAKKCGISTSLMTDIILDLYSQEYSRGRRLEHDGITTRLSKNRGAPG